MKKDYLKKTLISAVLLASLSLTACGGTSAAKTSSSSDSKGVQTVTVGCGNAYKPYCYLDDNGKAVGYEYDVLKAVDKKLPDIQFKYETMDFDNILLSLNSGKIDIAAHQYEETEERKQNYLFGKVPYTTFNTYITVLKTNNDIKSLDDLQGKKVWAGGTTSAANQILTDYNEKHKDNPIQIVNNSDTSAEYQVTSLQNGAFDASIVQERDIDSYNKDYGEVLKKVGEPVNSSLTYWLYQKGNTALQEKVDKALQEIKDDGTLAKISEKWLGGDYTG